VKKIVALEEQWLACSFRQGVSKTIPKVKLRRMPTAPSKIAISLTSDARLFGGDGVAVVDDAPVRQQQQPIGKRRGVRVVSDHHHRLAEVVDRVLGLCAKSLVIVDAGEDTFRYRMHNATRLYGIELS